MDHIYKLYQNEPFVIPAEIIYSDNFGAYPHANVIIVDFSSDGTKIKFLKN
jgi:hypothetical protein